MHPALSAVDHRPWPLPSRPWTWRQSWLDLLFIHYRVSSDSLRALLPSGIHLQEFDGSSWVGLVPFRMAGVMKRPFPDIWPFTSFPEMNLRTYVEVDGKPGVWFFSLDADCWPVVFGGRHIYQLPYYSAQMEHIRFGDWFHFSSARRRSSAQFRARYRPNGEPFLAKQGTFEHWIAERYCLYSFSRKHGLARVEVHHGPWPLQPAEVEINHSTILESASIKPLDDKTVCHFSPGVHVVSFSREQCL